MPCGLANLGNTCYMNSVLQTLAYIGEFDLKNFLYIVESKDFKFLSELHELLTKLRSNEALIANNPNDAKPKPGRNNNYVNPSSFKKAVDEIMPQFSGFDENDVHEFLTCLLESLNQMFLKEKNKDFMQSEEINKSKEGMIYNLFLEYWRIYLNLYKPQCIEYIKAFQGMLANKTQCCSCGQFTLKFEPFNLLSIPTVYEHNNEGVDDFSTNNTVTEQIPIDSTQIKNDLNANTENIENVKLNNVEGTNETEIDDEEMMFDNGQTGINKNQEIRHIDASLKQFFTEELLQNDEAWYCPDCKQKTTSKRSTSIYKYPKILILHLKRFNWSMDYGFTKLMHTIGLNQNLTIAMPLFDGSQIKFKLHSVINHQGFYHCGHYTTTCFDDNSNTWHIIDDPCIFTTTASKVINQDNYLLCFRQINI